jgi:hypothetical protein
MSGPHDIDAERALLGALMRGAVVDGLPGEHFYSPGHRLIYEAIEDLRGDGKPADPIAVADEMRRRRTLAKLGGKGASYLHDCLAAAPATPHAGFYAGIVRELAERRALIEHGSRIIQAASDPGADMASVRALAAGEASAPPGAETAFARCGLAEIDRANGESPELACRGMLYRGRVHSLAGEPDSGKTTLGYSWALETVRAGHLAVIFDQECGTDAAAARLRDLGATDAELDAVAYYPFPGRAWGPGNRAALAAEMTDVKPGLMLWDSVAEFMAAAGLDEDRAGDVTRFYSQVLRPCTASGAAVVILDHNAKQATGSRYARGSGAKLAGVDVAYRVEALTPFSRDRDGSLSLTVTKDRAGWLHRDWLVQVTRSPLAVTIAKAEPRPAGQNGKRGMSPATLKVLAALTDDPQTGRQLGDRIAATHGTGLKRETISRALNALADAGLADCLDPGPGRSHLWMRNSRSDL